MAAVRKQGLEREIAALGVQVDAVDDRITTLTAPSGRGRRKATKAARRGWCSTARSHPCRSGFTSSGRRSRGRTSASSFWSAKNRVERGCREARSRRPRHRDAPGEGVRRHCGAGQGERRGHAAFRARSPARGTGRTRCGGSARADEGASDRGRAREGPAGGPHGRALPPDQCAACPRRAPATVEGRVGAKAGRTQRGRAGARVPGRSALPGVRGARRMQGAGGGAGREPPPGRSGAGGCPVGPGRTRGDSLGAQEELHEARSILRSLETLQRNFEGYQEGVRAVMLKHESNGASDGCVAWSPTSSRLPGDREGLDRGVGRTAPVRHRPGTRGRRGGHRVPQTGIGGTRRLHSAAVRTPQRPRSRDGVGSGRDSPCWARRGEGRLSDVADYLLGDVAVVKNMEADWGFGAPTGSATRWSPSTAK